MARGIRREDEMRMRTGLGAGRLSLVKLLPLEPLVLAAIWRCRRIAAGELLLQLLVTSKPEPPPY